MSDPNDRSDLLLGLSWFWTTTSIIAVSARFWCRVNYQRKVWWDDYWVLIAACLSLCMSVTWTVYANGGGARHVGTLTPVQIVNSARLNWISQPMCIACLVCGKISVACMIKRLQSPTKWRTIVLWVLCTIIAVYSAIEIILIFVQCKPVYLLWNPKADPTGKCWNPAVVTNNALVISSYLAALDLIFIAIPVHMVWNLQLPMKKKIGICALLSTGIFAFVCGVIKVTELSNDSVRDDLTWATVDLFIWNANEANVVIIAACVPTLVPLYEILTGRRKKNFYTGGNQYNNDYYRHQPSELRNMSNPHRSGDTSSHKDLLAEEERYKPTVTTDPYLVEARAQHGRGIEVTKQFTVANHSRV